MSDHVLDPQDLALEDLEASLLLEALKTRFGYDFTSYAQASLRRRMRAALATLGLGSFSELQVKVLHEAGYFATRLLPNLTVTTSEMFRDPSFFAAFRQQVVPVLATYPTFKIWVAGAGSGEEVFSLAIVLKEEGLLDKAVIYATDVNPLALQRTKEGMYSHENVQTFTRNYQKAGGRGVFSDYYTAAYGAVRFDPALIAGVVFAEHNLIGDQVFADVNAIFCRNVLIYFERAAQKRVVDLFRKSLEYKGYLLLGSKEHLVHLAEPDVFEPAVASERIYRKIKRDDPGEARLVGQS